MISTSTVLLPTRGTSFKTGRFMAPREKRSSNWKACRSTGLTAIQATGLRTIASSARRRNRRGAHDHPVSSPRRTRRPTSVGRRFFVDAPAFRCLLFPWDRRVPHRSPQRRQEGSRNGEMPTRALGRACFVYHVRSARFSSVLNTTD